MSQTRIAVPVFCEVKVDQQMNAKSPDEVPVGALGAQLVQFRFIAVYHVVGLTELPEHRTLVIPLGIEHVTAELVRDPNVELLGIDEGTAAAVMLLRGALPGDLRQPDIKAHIDHAVEEIVADRAKAFPAPAVYLVVKAVGDVQSTPTDVSRDLGHAVLAFDAIDKAAISEQYRSLVNSIVSATALTVGLSPSHVIKVADGVEARLADGSPLYSRTFVMGSLGMRVSRPASASDAAAIARRTLAVHREPRLDTGTRLFVDSLGRSTDRLEAFLLAWASLEIIIRKFTKGCEDGTWTMAVPTIFQEEAAKVHRQYLERGGKEYGLVDRARVLCMSRGIDNGEEFAKAVNSIRKNHREPIYHEGKLDEVRLPVEKVIELTRQLTLKLIDPG